MTVQKIVSPHALPCPMTPASLFVAPREAEPVVEKEGNPPIPPLAAPQMAERPEANLPMVAKKTPFRQRPVTLMRTAPPPTVQTKPGTVSAKTLVPVARACPAAPFRITAPTTFHSAMRKGYADPRLTVSEEPLAEEPLAVAQQAVARQAATPWTVAPQVAKAAPLLAM